MGKSTAPPQKDAIKNSKINCTRPEVHTVLVICSSTSNMRYHSEHFGFRVFGAHCSWGTVHATKGGATPVAARRRAARYASASRGTMGIDTGNERASDRARGSVPREVGQKKVGTLGGGRVERFLVEFANGPATPRRVGAAGERRPRRKGEKHITRHPPTGHGTMGGLAGAPGIGGGGAGEAPAGRGGRGGREGPRRGRPAGGEGGALDHVTLHPSLSRVGLRSEGGP